MGDARRYTAAVKASPQAGEFEHRLEAGPPPFASGSGGGDGTGSTSSWSACSGCNNSIGGPSATHESDRLSAAAGLPCRQGWSTTPGGARAGGRLAPTGCGAGPSSGTAFTRSDPEAVALRFCDSPGGAPLSSPTEDADACDADHCLLLPSELRPASPASGASSSPASGSCSSCFAAPARAADMKSLALLAPSEAPDQGTLVLGGSTLWAVDVDGGRIPPVSNPIGPAAVNTPGGRSKKASSCIRRRRHAPRYLACRAASRFELPECKLLPATARAAGSARATLSCLPDSARPAGFRTPPSLPPRAGDGELSG